ncbi:olfactory receptor 146-like [Oncorhynchus keta]|uniref:olfactory receptor 146-like n=1 Tax=Oncorhynchus keta TaxID=8018 RepID=UPI0015FA10AE|nr:olfactory receptor 146-like [Oncorhynchus keta]
MENYTYPNHVLLLEGLKVTQQSSYPAFILFLIIYIFTMVANIGLISLISMERSLHQPMYILFCNLPLNDIVGATVMIPRLLWDILTTAPERYITYTECVIQAFCTHVYATTSHTVLMIMAFDRYVAICNPLRYATIMTNKMVIRLSMSAWGVAMVLVGILLGLTIRLSRCRSNIFNPYCDNASLFKLSCESVFINNIYGLIFTVVLFVSSIGSISLTYLKIAIVCLSSKNSSLNSKALTTCSTHLLVYLIVLGCGFTIIVLHRFPAFTDLRKVSSVLGSVVPTCLNPIIYGLQTKEIKQRIFRVFHRAKVAA